MSKTIFNLTFLGILLLSIQVIANGQDKNSKENKDRNIIVVGATKTLEVTGRVSYIVVKETAKVAWQATKFTAGEMVAPVADAVVLKAAPKVTLFVLKRGTPIAAKLLLTYLKL